MKGRHHETQSAFAIGAALIPLTQLFGYEAASAFAIGGLAGTYFLSPDLDLEDSRPSRRWGALNFLWIPYRWLHRHRGASHTYIYGPLSRLVYLGLLLFGVLWGAQHYLNLPLPELPRWQGTLPFLLSGYFFSQWLHLLQDGIMPGSRRRRRRRRKNKAAAG